ncbi:MAG: heme-binding protein [Planctomycetota bacterium]
MSVDGWTSWLRRWGAAPTRRVSSFRTAGRKTECFEERLLLGQLTPAELPAEPSELAQVEVALAAAEAMHSGFEVSPSAYSILQTAGIVAMAEPTPVAEDVVLAFAETPIPTTPVPTTTDTIGGTVKGDDPVSSKVELTAFKAEQREALRTARKASRAASASNKASSGSNVTSSASVETTGATDANIGSGVGGTSGGNDASGAATTNASAAGSVLGMNLFAGASGGEVSTSTSGPSQSSYKPEALANLIGDPQLKSAEVQQLLDRASAATPSQDAIIVVVDRQGIILGVRTEAGVSTADLATLVFSIDGAVAEARTAAYFSNNQGVLTSRTVRFISQTTITEREVDSNPSITDMNSTIAGPGFVAPIGLGGHFPPGVAHTPPVDLFGIEHTNRDSIDEYPGGEGRFNADYISAAKEINAPGSYGLQSGLMPDALPRGIATLPGGIPLYRDTDGNGIGDTLIGGIGVFFPGPDGYASYEQGFVHGDGNSTTSRTNAPLVLEAEAIALAAIGSSRQAGVTAGPVGGVAPVMGIDLPFPRIDLVGITLEAVGPTAGIEGVRQIKQLLARLGPGVVNGTDQLVTPAMTLQDGKAVPTGWLVAAHDGVGLTAADVTKIINQGITEANRVRAAIRGPLGTRTKMVFAVTDTTGEVLGLYRMDDATYFSFDVAVAKARNMAYYNNPATLQPQDRVLAKQDPAVNPKGVAFTSRTFRFLVEPRYPSGVDGTKAGPFSILNETSINPKNGENIGAPAPANTFQTAQGYDSFNIGTNFHDTSTSPDNQNGVVFFPGSTGIYKNGVLVGGLGVSGDGVDQDDVVTTAAIKGFAAPSGIRADQYTYRNVRLPYNKFLRNPYG